jgi:hypothetical protein
MATGRAAPAGPRQTAVPTQADPDGHPTAVASPLRRARQTGCHLVAIPPINGQRNRKVRDQPEQTRAATTAGSHFNNVPTGRAARLVMINGRATRTVQGQVRIRRKGRSGSMATTRSPPLWRTSSAGFDA